MDLAGVGPADFEPLVGAVFRAGSDDGTVDLVLAAVERGSGGSDGRPFRLVFRGGPASHLPQGTVPLTREGAGRLDLFLVPAAPDEMGPLYVAVFG